MNISVNKPFGPLSYIYLYIYIYMRVDLYVYLGSFFFVSICLFKKNKEEKMYEFFKKFFLLTNKEA